MTKYSEIVELPDGNKIFIHYGSEQFTKQYPIRFEYLNKHTDQLIKFKRREKSRTKRLRKREKYTRKLSLGRIPLLPSSGNW